MRLLRVIDSMNPATGGPCQGVRNSIPELEKLGVKNEVVCLDAPGAPYLNEDFVIHAIGPGKGPWSYSPKLVPWLLDNLHRFDVVIVHGLWLYHGFAVWKAFQYFKHRQSVKAKNKTIVPKLFVMPHGMLDPYFQRASGRKLKAIRNWIYWKLIERRLVNEAAGLLFTCQAELLLARKPFHPYKPQQEVNVGYGILEPPSFTIQMSRSFYIQCPEVEGQPFFLFLSRIHEKKGVDILVEAYAHVARRLANRAKDHRLHQVTSASVTNSFLRAELPMLVIAGPGISTTYGQKLLQRVNGDPILRSNVFFPGMLTGDAKWGAFYNYKAFVLPSHQENFGIAVTEALACGKPVLISCEVNICREIQSMGGGLIGKDTQKGTTDIITQWMNLSSEEQLQMEVNARQTFERFFAVAPAVKQLMSAIQS